MGCHPNPIDELILVKMGLNHQPHIYIYTYAYIYIHIYIWLKIAIEIVDLPINKGGSFHSVIGVM